MWCRGGRLEMKERYRRPMRCLEARHGGKERREGMRGRYGEMWFSGDGGGITMRAQEGAAGRECAVEELVLEVRRRVMEEGARTNHGGCTVV